MKRADLLFLFVILFPLCACSYKAKECNNISQKNIVINEDNKPVSKKDSITILTLEYLSHLGDSVNYTVSNDEVIKFFDTGEKITDEDAINIIEKQSYKYFIIGELLLNNDTIPYTILPSGVGFYDIAKLTDNKSISMLVYFKNEKIINQENHIKIRSDINIISYKKREFDFALWELWRKEDSDSIYSYDSQEYKAYKRWNEKLYTDAIYKAFNLCKEVASYEKIDYLHNVGLHCGLDGYLIKNERIYYFRMDSGGIFELFLTNQYVLYRRKIYGCFISEGLNYFVDYLHNSED
ncbi:hypothetical protein [Dysgonomonas sp. ZJ279]|uniref:hypothetical protein n=1 Tax=Dysgonomonas sp. ZJ279 TaxID=2709796 RepID=UPI0013ED1D82|nr:hypothetical protein [Dysgonomonas sp. ZJ279]